MPKNPRKPRDPYKVACGQRLKFVRQALDFTSYETFADENGVGRDAYNSWERGVNMVPPSFVQKLKAKYGVTHEYIYSDDPTRLPGDLRDRLTMLRTAAE